MSWVSVMLARGRCPRLALIFWLPGADRVTVFLAMRMERDSMGEMPIPDDALYGASTQRAVLNFPVSGRPMPAGFIRGLGLVKLACAAANEELGLLPAEKSRLIRQVAQEVVEDRKSVV